jgi:hypothetical protein
MVTDQTVKKSPFLIFFVFYRISNPEAVPGIPDGPCVSILQVA